MSALEILFETLAGGCLLASVALCYQMIGEVNRKLPDDQQISYFFFHFEKIERIKREYRRLYPNSCVDFIQAALGWTGFIFVLLAGWTSAHAKH
jgi:hypothetical protein